MPILGVLRAIWLSSVVVLGVALMLPLAASSAPPKPSWKCISGVCIGTGRSAVEARFAPTDPNTLSFSVNVPGGRLWLSFFKQVDWVALDNATRLNYVSQIQTCDPIFRLPDGVVKGTKGVPVGSQIPVGSKWRGYKLVAYGSEFDPLAPVWEKRLQTGTKKFRVRLHVRNGQVRCVGLSRVLG